MSQANGDEKYDLNQLAEILDRSVLTCRKYVLFEGLVHTRERGRILVSRADLDEWLGREEIQDMLKVGSYHRGRPASRRNRTVRTA